MKVFVVIPVYNEEMKLRGCIERTMKYLTGKKFHYEVCIADNASTDRTLEIAKELSKKYKGVTYIHLDEKGRGRALKKAWSGSDADVMMYMDVDLSTDLGAIERVIGELKVHDIVIGSRLVKGARVQRGIFREALSRGYNIIISILIPHKFRDAQCGFKAINQRVKKELLPHIKNDEWFFDTELLIKGEKKGYGIKELPIGWRDQPDSRVNILRTIWDYLVCSFRLRKELKSLD